MLTSNNYGVGHCNSVDGVWWVTTVRTSRCRWHSLELCIWAVLLHSHDGMAMWFLCLFPVCLVSPYQYLSWYNAFTSFSSIVFELADHFPLCFVLRVLLLWCFLVVGCVFVWNRDGCCTMYRSYSATYQWRYLDASIVNLRVLCNMQSNVLNDLTVQLKWWDTKESGGKKDLGER